MSSQINHHLQSTIHDRSFAREGVSKPTSLGTRIHPGQHRGARPFSTFPGDVKAACPAVNRDVLVRVRAWEPISNKERVRSVEEAVSKTVAPTKVSGVRVPGAPPCFIRSIGVSASTAVFHAAEAGAAPAWSANVFSSRGVRVCTPPCEGGGSGCESSREHQFSMLTMM